MKEISELTFQDLLFEPDTDPTSNDLQPYQVFIRGTSEATAQAMLAASDEQLANIKISIDSLYKEHQASYLQDIQGADADQLAAIERRLNRARTRYVVLNAYLARKELVSLQVLCDIYNHIDWPPEEEEDEKA